MDYLPIFLKLRDAPCLVVGGGEVAGRKLGLLLEAGAAVTVIAPSADAAIAELAERGRIRLRTKTFDADDADGFRLVIAATDDREVNEEVAATGRRLGIPVNVVDCPALCDFIFPAIVDRSPVVIAVSTGGASPVLGRLLRTRIEACIPSGFGTLARIAGGLRDRVKRAIPDARARRHFWEQGLQGPAAELALQGRAEEAEMRLLEEAEAAATQGGPSLGSVALVGAGPGDPDLLTLRALRLIQEADVVVYDRLVSPEILALVRRDARRIYAGKERSRHSIPQDDINELLGNLASEGHRVVRLKGGDPFIFGRGGEEIETLMARHIPFQVVPGITAASGCAAYAGIPLTHRDHAHACLFVAGHLKDGSLQGIDWPQLARPRQTVVVYMGLQGLPQICAELIRHGAPPSRPAALIQQGTTSEQRVVSATLETLPARVADSNVKAPTLVIIGEVVTLREKLAWYRGRAEREEMSANGR
ncbi:siroheme synthase CysG [Methylococcus geothermalis]|uniref:Siroheme synthase n=1 Tax=Methylococcus geothermalis TaxID=2681310 RepID=A0A858Q819_9GAMM|nr:siroheme synthase CysG [Methylococcus geothermalis]QJD29924.1 uroporphyrinogen-III C-methyltransferase [Methylococcus geothermalis]